MRALSGHLPRPSAFQDPVFSTAEHSIGEATDVCEDAGADLGVVSVPPTAMVKDPVSLGATAAEPDRVDLRSADMHWNAALGRRLAATVVRQVAAR